MSSERVWSSNSLLDALIGFEDNLPPKHGWRVGGGCYFQLLAPPLGPGRKEILVAGMLLRGEQCLPGGRPWVPGPPPKQDKKPAREASPLPSLA